VSRWGAKRPQVFSFAAKIAGAAARPIATQGRSYKGQCWLKEISKTVTSSHVQYLWELACRRLEGEALPCGPQPFFTLNHAAYNAGRNSKVSTVATIKPPMIATAIGP